MTPDQSPDDDDLTILAQATRISTPTDVQNATQPNEHVLPIGTILGEFEIIDIIGWGGFGIVYLVYDHSLERKVALKEYMPSSFAIRNNLGEITLRSESNREIFLAGLRSFINEARLLAHFDHPSLVKVYRFWESNGTAYMVMPFYKGITLKEKILNADRLPEEKWLKNLLFQLLEALNVLHKDIPSCLHRDISPDNILILSDGRALLLDFGAARRVISNMTQSLTVILKPGYAPIEQYADEINLTQGPWTDIYALAAVIYFAITRKAPTPSVSRLISDKLTPLNEFAVNQYSNTFLNGIDRALAIRPEHRPQSVEEFHRLLGLAQQQIVSEQFSASSESTSNKWKILAALAVTAITVTSVVMLNPNMTDPQREHTDSSTQVLDQSIQFNPISELEAIFDARDRSHAVTISIAKAQVIINEDQLNFKIRSAKSGYIYIFAIGTNQSEFLLLFPNGKDHNNFIAANQQIELPRKEWRMIAGGPPGNNHFIAIVSSHPRSFSNTGLQEFGIFQTFSFEHNKETYRSYKGTLPFFIGQAICTSDSASNCSESYGATLFSIEEIIN